jgi:hypothetical protein
MSENQVMYFGTFFCLILIIYSYKVDKSLLIKNCIIWIIYNAILYYGLLFKGEYGMSLGWFILIILSTILQVLIVSIFLVVKYLKR